MNKLRVLTALLLIGIYTSTTAQNTGPVAPEAVAFEPVDANNMVNMVTGDFSYVIPILHVPGPGGGYPLALSYHGGVAMDQEASWVGLGWNINPGAINRSINGVPDDWLQKLLATEVYADLGTYETYTIGAGVCLGSDALVSLGGSYTWGSYRSFGVNLGVGMKGSPFSAGVSFDSQSGFGVNVGYGPLSFAVDQNGTMSLGASATAWTGGSPMKGIGLSSGMGITLSSGKFYGSITAMGVGQSFPLSNSFNDDDIHSSSSGFSISISAYIFYVSFSHQKTHYWLYRNYKDEYYGTLYTRNAEIGEDDVNYYGLQKKNVKMDSYIIPFDKESYFNSDSAAAKNNLLYAAYDNYNVSAQGLMGNITPRVYANTVLTHDSYFLNSEKTKELVWHFWGDGIASGGVFNPQFYFENENVGYMAVNGGRFTGTQELTSIQYQNNYSTNYQYNGKNYNGHTNNRRVSGNYIQWFTNRNIANNTAKGLGLIQDSVYSHLRGDDKLFDPDGIGAFTITALDGKTYHFSLPVYQDCEVLRKNGEKTGDFMEKRKMDMYAFSWLLTAVTGPDYFDTNNDGFANDGDYGYWVNFKYGKYGDFYFWQFPYDLAGKTYTTYKDEIMWGGKQIYYLNSVETPTHAAYFLKKERLDGLSNMENSRKITDTIYTKSGKIPPGDWNINTQPLAYKYSKSISYSFTQKLKPLMLDRIILLKKNASSHIVKQNGTNGKIGTATYTRLLKTIWPNYERKIEYSRDFYANHGEVLISNDITNLVEIEKNAQKTIEFNYGYNLCTNTPNSDAPNKGKLTLNSVSIKGTNNKKVSPDYIFSYNQLGTNSFNKTNKDLWGYDKNYPENWSLKEIILPTGANIGVNYEKNTFKYEAVYGNKIPIVYSVIQGNTCKVKLAADITNLSVGRTYEISGDLYCNFSIDIILRPQEDPTKIMTSNHLAKSYEGNITINQIGTDSTITFNVPDFMLSNYNIPPTAYDVTLSKISGFMINLPDDFSQYGGGIRVKDISITDELGNKNTTVYSYSKPNTNLTSGTICYSPYGLEKKYVPYISELPAPKVIYSHVKVTQNGSPISTQYEFEGYQDVDDNVGDINFAMGKQFRIENLQEPELIVLTTGQGKHPGKAYGRSSTIVNNFNTIGRLKSVKTVNSVKHTLSSQLYEYYDTSEMLIGFEKETFNYFKRYATTKNGWVNSNSIFNFNATSKCTYPNQLKSVKYVSDGYQKTVYNDLIDFYTGNVLSTRTVDSDNKEYVTELLPAYNVYGKMGPKSLDTANANMLSQEAATLSYIYDDRNHNYKPVGVSVQTWSNNWVERNFNNTAGVYEDQSLPNVWRKHKTFAWGGELVYNPLSDVQGHYGADFANYNSPDSLIANWSDFDGDGINGWVKTSEVTRYNRYSMPLEIADINNRKASSKTDVDGVNTVSSASNAGHTEFTASGFERNRVLTSSLVGFDGDVIAPMSCISVHVSSNAPANINGLKIASINAHTGYRYINLVPKSSSSVTYGGPSIALSQVKGKTYRVSLWVHSASTGAILFGMSYKNLSSGQTHTATISRFSGNSIKTFGDWQLYSGTFNMPYELASGNINFYVECTGTGKFAYIDDFRVQPMDASVSSYVYDPITDAVTYILNNDNIATKYEYDEVGRLRATYKETEAGFKKVSEHNQGFARPTDGVFTLNGGVGYNTWVDLYNETRNVNISANVTNNDFAPNIINIGIGLEGFPTQNLSGTVEAGKSRSFSATFSLPLTTSSSPKATITGDITAERIITIPVTPATLKLVSLTADMDRVNNGGSVNIFASFKNIGSTTGTFNNLLWEHITPNGIVTIPMESFSLNSGGTISRWINLDNLQIGAHSIGVTSNGSQIGDYVVVSCSNDRIIPTEPVLEQ